jgi:hypothetical protein
VEVGSNEASGSRLGYDGGELVGLVCDNVGNGIRSLDRSGLG